MALKELGQYSQAVPLFEQAVQTHRSIIAADPKDLRALADLERALRDEASSYEDAANPALENLAGDRRRKLLTAERLLEQAAATFEQMLKQDPNNDDWKAFLANTQVRIGTIRQLLHAPEDSQALSRTGLAVLKTFADKDQASPMVLDLALTSILRVEPASLRDPRLAVAWAERGVAFSHRKTPAWLLSLAQAYRSAGQVEKGRAAANEGLALLPALPPGTNKSRVRKLLELEARPPAVAALDEPTQTHSRL